MQVTYKGATVDVMSLCGASPDAMLVRLDGTVEACVEVKTRSFFKVMGDGLGGEYLRTATLYCYGTSLR